MDSIYRSKNQINTNFSFFENMENTSNYIELPDTIFHNVTINNATK